MSYELEKLNFIEAAAAMDAALLALEKAITPERDSLILNGDIAGLKALANSLPEDCILKLYIYTDIEEVAKGDIKSTSL